MASMDLSREFGMESSSGEPVSTPAASPFLPKLKSYIHQEIGGQICATASKNIFATQHYATNKSYMQEVRAGRRQDIQFQRRYRDFIVLYL